MKRQYSTNKISYLVLTAAIFVYLWAGVPTCAQEAAEPASISPSDRMDMLDIKNMDILDVLKLISQKSGVNIVASQEVKGRISVYLKDIDAEKALEVIARSNNWAFKKEEGIIHVMSAKEFEERYGYKFGETTVTRIEKLTYAKAAEIGTIVNQIKSPSGKVVVDEKSNTLIIKDSPAKIDEVRAIIERVDVPTESRVYELGYAPAEEIANKIRLLATPSVGKVEFDARSNTLVVSDTPTRIAEMELIINTFDKKERVVQIDAKILSVLLSDEYKWGIDWQAMVAEYHDLNAAGDFDILNAGDKKGTLSIGTLADDNYTAMVQALETAGATNILSNPSITTLSNREAKILVGSEEPYVTSTTTTTAAGPSTTAESVNFIEVGVKLFVTPTIHKDDFITVKIKPEVSSVVRTVTTGNNNVIPVVETSQAETTVTVKDGVTIVIGGLIKDEDIEESKQVPFLGRIPILGYAFKNKSDLSRKTEIVILLKPKIVSGDQQASLY
jgi:general secretion pathway protein D